MIAVGVVLLVFASADKRVAVLQVVRDLPAGTQLTADDVRSIDVSADPSLAVVHAVDLPTIVGQYATMPVRLQVQGKELAASWGMDVMVAPASPS